MSFSARCKPFPDSTVKVLDDIMLGFSFAADRNQFGNLKYISPDSLDNEIEDLDRRPVSIFGFAYTLPIIKKEKFTIGNYAEMAHITDYGTGYILPGIYTDFKFLRVNLEYRIYGKQFTPAFFDRDYEEERAIVVIDTVGIDTADFITKESTLETLKASQGWAGSINAVFGKKLKAMFAWENTFGKELKTGKSIWFKLWVDTQYKRLENVSFAYSKTKTETMAIHRINMPNAQIAGSATFRVSKKRWFLIGSYAEKYIDRNGDNSINWLKETKRSVGVGVKYIF